jgi:hypothetical protein
LAQRWSASPASRVKALQPFPHEAQIDVAIDQSQQVIFRNLLFQAEIK